MSRPASPKRPSSREASSKRPYSPGDMKKKETFRVGGGKMSYDDMFLQFKEEEMIGASGRPSTTGHTSVREQLRKGAEGENIEEETDHEAVMNMAAWDESELQEAERIIKGLRANLKEYKGTVEALKEKQDMLLTEKVVMTELLQERKLMAEKSLAVAAKLQEDYDKLLGQQKAGGMGFGEGDGADGFSSWRADRARLGRKLDETEAKNAQLLTEKVFAEERLFAIQEQINQSGDGNMKKLAQQEEELTALRAQLLIEQTSCAAEREAKELLEQASENNSKSGGNVTLLETTNTNLKEEVESLKIKLEISNGKLKMQMTKMKELQEGLDYENEESIALRLAKEVEKNNDLSEKYNKVNRDLIDQAKVITDNATHIEKLQESIEEKNGMNVECREIIKSLEESAVRIQSDLEGKIALIDEQQNELVRIKVAADAAAIAAEAHNLQQHVKIDVMQVEIARKRECLILLEKEMADASEAHKNSFANMTKIQDDLKAQLAKSDNELNVKKATLIDWEKKMSLFDIMQEMEQEAKAREAELLAQIAAFEKARALDRLESDANLHNWKHTEDHLLMVRADDFYLRLLDQERDKVRQLELVVTDEKKKNSDQLAEIRAINEAREIEQLEFEKSMKLSMNNVTEELRAVNSARTVEASLLNSIINSLKTDANHEAEIARTTIAARVQDIADRDKNISELIQAVSDMKCEVFKKDTELVRARAENEDFRIKYANRAHDEVVSITVAALEAKRILNTGSSARAPRLRITQLEEHIEACELRANKWQRIANEYMLEAPNSYQNQNNDGYAVPLSAIDGSVYGVGSTSVLEHMIGSVANKLVNTHSVNEIALVNLRKWISENNVTEDSECRALRSVLLSWAGLESLAGIRSIAEQYGTASFPDTDSKPTSNQVQSKDANFFADVEQRLFSTFELGKSTIAEFRVLREIHVTLGVSVDEISSLLDMLNLSLSSCADRAIQDLSDNFELRIVQNTRYDLRIIDCILSAPGMECSKEFLHNMQILRRELSIAEDLREEYAVLRSSYNQSVTQIALMQDLNKLSERDRLSARTARRTPRAPMETGIPSIAADTPILAPSNVERKHEALASEVTGVSISAAQAIRKASVHEIQHTEHVHHGSLAVVRKTLKKEVSDERNRRYEEARQRGMDFNALSTMERRASRLIQRADHNLACLELEMAEGGNEIDKSRIVFVKLLRHRLSREASSKGEHSHLAKRIKNEEKNTDTFLVHLEEAISALDLSEVNGNQTVSSGDTQSSVTALVDQHVKDLHARINTCNERIDIALEAVLKGRDDEVRSNSKLFRVLEVKLNALMSKNQNDENNSLSLELNKRNNAMTSIVASLQLQVQDVRRKDAALERVHYLLHTFAGNIIDQKYKSQLQGVYESLMKLQIVDENGLSGGGENVLATRIRWNNERIPSMNTLPNSRYVHNRHVDASDSNTYDNVNNGRNLSLDSGPETETEIETQTDADLKKPVIQAKTIRPPSGISPLNIGVTSTTTSTGVSQSKLNGTNSGPGSSSLSLKGGRIFPEGSNSPPQSHKSATDVGYQQSLETRRNKNDISEEKAMKNAANIKAEAEAAAADKAAEEAQRRLELMHEMRSMKAELLNEFNDLKVKPKSKEGCTVM